MEKKEGAVKEEDEEVEEDKNDKEVEKVRVENK